MVPHGVPRCGALAAEPAAWTGAPHTEQTIAAPDATVAESTPDTSTETSVAPTSEPEGWVEATGDAAAPLNARLAACVGIDGDEISAADAVAAAGPFASRWPTRRFASTSARSRPRPRHARSWAFTVEPGVLGCFEEAYAELAAGALVGTAADGSTFGAPSVTRLQIGPACDSTQAIRVIVPVTGDPPPTRRRPRRSRTSTRSQRSSPSVCPSDSGFGCSTAWR